jgi:16S rRNA (guanine527-N7)-methyltransferase
VAARDRGLTPETAVLERWLAAVVSTPGLTAFRDAEQARGPLLEDALRATSLLRREGGPVVDVGSGGGTPGLPLAVALPQVGVTVLDADGRKCAFLERWAAELPNLRVRRGRAEDQPLETFRVALAKALAPPPVALEWCLPLVGEGGAVILWTGPTADLDRVAAAAGRLAGRLESTADGLVVVRKTGPTPPGFPRRTGVARKRPLA